MWRNNIENLYEEEDRRSFGEVHEFGVTVGNKHIRINIRSS